MNKMKDITHFFLGYILFLLIFPTVIVAAPQPENVDKSGLALQGYDPVSYHINGPSKGSDEFSITHDGVTYLFSSAANRDRFSSNPSTYIPAYGGWCAWAMLEGEKVEVDPENFKIVEGRNLLFYNSFFTNTLDSWNKLAVSDTEEELVRRAQSHWQNVLNK